MDKEPDLREQLEAARATAAAQAIQIHQLEQQVQKDGELTALREILQLSDILGATVGQAPYRSLLEGIIEAARRLFDARAASIALLDHNTDELVFEAATDQDVVGMRFPGHQGIAGWVMVTGEPIAVGDVRRDTRFAKDFAESTGYVPQSILAVPLIVRDEIEGVLEVLDKANAATFGLNDMELLSLFARPAAVAVEQARMVGNVGGMLIAELARLAEEQGQPELADAAQKAVAAGSETSGDTLELAHLVYRLTRRGDRARRLAIDVLTSVGKYAGVS